MKQTAIKAAKEAGIILMKYYGKGIKGRVKFEDNLVSKADLEAEKKIISTIRITIFMVYPYLGLQSLYKRIKRLS